MKAGIKWAGPNSAVPKYSSLTKALQRCRGKVM